MSEAPNHPQSGRKIETLERIVLAAAFAVVALLAIAFMMRGGFDSDEPQHLHVAWEWTQGRIQYRDVFDNHAPLFHLVMAPIAALVGERFRILVIMRFVNSVFYVLALVGAYLLSGRFFERRVALWTAALVAVYPAFFRYALQFRPDTAWTAVVALSLWVLVGGNLTARRGFVSGLLLGVAAGVSLKTSLVFVALLGAAALLPLASASAWHRLSRRGVLAAAAGLCAGVLVVPVFVAVSFAALGAWKDFVRCTVAHNVLPGFGRWGHSLQMLIVFPVIAATWLAARGVDKRGASLGVDARFTFLVCVAGTSLAALVVMPLVRPQTTLPAVLIVIVVAAGLADELVLGKIAARPGARSAGAFALAVPVVVFLTGAGLSARYAHLGRDNTREGEERLEAVLALTGPADYVLDAKGENIFRRRPCYFVLEQLTLERIRRGLTGDDVVKRCIETKTLLFAGRLRAFPAADREFIKTNYLPTGAVAVAGKVLSAEAVAPGARISFEVVIPAEYAVLGDAGEGRGALDGSAYTGARYLDAGAHAWVNSSPQGRLYLVWSRAVQRGFLPTGLWE